MANRVTHTFAILEISAAAYKEIYDKLKSAGYEHSFIDHDGGIVIDMQGIGLFPEEYDPNKRPDPTPHPDYIGKAPNE